MRRHASPASVSCDDVSATVMQEHSAASDDGGGIGVAVGDEEMARPPDVTCLMPLPAGLPPKAAATRAKVQPGKQVMGGGAVDAAEGDAAVRDACVRPNPGGAPSSGSAKPKMIMARAFSRFFGLVILVTKESSRSPRAIGVR